MCQRFGSCVKVSAPSLTASVSTILDYEGKSGLALAVSSRRSHSTILLIVLVVNDESDLTEAGSSQ